MNGQPKDLLVFRIAGGHYALDAALVRRTLWLPELSPAPDTPPEIVGRFNLQGEIIPVADLTFHLDRKSHRPQASDQVVVLDLDEGPLGIRVSEVMDLVHPVPEQFLSNGEPDAKPADGLVTGTLQLGDDLVTLLDARQICRTTGTSLSAQNQFEDESAAPADRALFRVRAQALREADVAEEESGQVLAVVELGGQYFGIDLAAVREFCRLPPVSPLPCCPPHIAGIFNLRGHLITLLEISSAFGLTPPALPRPKAVIGLLDGEAVGVAVDDVIDVFNPQAAGLQPVPSSLVRENAVDIRAITTFAGRRVMVLDLAGLLKQDRWLVDETIA